MKAVGAWLVGLLKALWEKYQTEPAVFYSGVLGAAAYIVTQIFHKDFTSHEQDYIKGALGALPFILSLIVRAKVTPQRRIETVVTKILDANRPVVSIPVVEPVAVEAPAPAPAETVVNPVSGIVDAASDTPTTLP